MSKTNEEIVQEFCKRLSPEANSAIIDVKIADGAGVKQWRTNVDAKVAKDGGSAVEGWAIWYEDDILVEGEACIVWQSPKGELIEVTPRDHEYPQIMFVAQPGIWAGGGPVNNKRQCMSDNPMARMAFLSGEWKDKLRKQFGAAEGDIPESEIEKVDKACQRILMRDVRNWERCPCGSGKPFPKCCGKPKGRPWSNF